MIRILIVDDERPSRDGLRVRIEKEPGFEVIGEAASGKAAVAALRKLDPDVMFLDIRMPDMSGFEVLKRMPAGRNPHVVFVTAFDKHALEAFEVHAIDYLVKPIVPRRLRAALLRARTLHSQRLATDTLERLAHALGDQLPAAAGAGPLPGLRDRIAVRDGTRVRMVPVRSIRWVEACGNYVMIHADSRLLHRATIREFVSQLPAREFARVHRGAIVNVSEVTEIRRDSHGDGEVVLRDGHVVRMSRRFRDALL